MAHALSKPGSFSAQIRARLLAGERLTAQQVNEEIGGSAGILAATAATMVKQGYEIERIPYMEGEYQRTAFRLLSGPDESKVGAELVKEPRQRRKNPNSRQSKIRAELLTGARLTAVDVQKRYGGDLGTLSRVMRVMRKEGYEFEREDVPPNRHGHYWLRSSEPGRPPALPDKTVPCKFCRRVLKNRESYRKHLARVHAGAKGIEVALADYRCDICQQNFRSAGGLAGHKFRTHGIGKSLPAPAPTAAQPDLLAPELGTTLRVTLLGIDKEDGSVRMGLRNGDGSWLCRIEGRTSQ